MRDWLIKLIREAIHAELSERLSVSEAKLTLIETKFADIAIRVKEKREAAEKDKPRAVPWSVTRKKLESE